jgi:hypothetical protein
VVFAFDACEHFGDIVEAAHQAVTEREARGSEGRP